MSAPARAEAAQTNVAASAAKVTAVVEEAIIVSLSESVPGDSSGQA